MVRQRNIETNKNFSCFSIQLYEMGFDSGTWNFFESGHGKGAPDGIGGASKRKTDNLANQTQNTSTLKELFAALKKDFSLKIFSFTVNVCRNYH